MGHRVLAPVALAVLAAVAHAGPGSGAAPAGRVVGKVAVTEANGKAVANAEVIVYVVGGPAESRWARA